MHIQKGYSLSVSCRGGMGCTTQCAASFRYGLEHFIRTCINLFSLGVSYDVNNKNIYLHIFLLSFYALIFQWFTMMLQSFINNILTVIITINNKDKNYIFHCKNIRYHHTILFQLVKKLHNTLCLYQCFTSGELYYWCAIKPICHF